MATAIQICNMALSHIGSEAGVTAISPSDGTREADLCATFYDQSRTELIEAGIWPFTLKRAALTATTSASDNWAYTYTKPTDCLRAVRILSASASMTVFAQDAYSLHTDDRDSAQFDVEGAVIYSNEPDAVLVYVQDITDTTKFTPAFTSALSFMLAGYLAGPIIKGHDGAKLADAMRQRAMTSAQMAETISANSSSAATGVETSITAVRA